MQGTFLKQLVVKVIQLAPLKSCSEMSWNARHINFCIGPICHLSVHKYTQLMTYHTDLYWCTKCLNYIGQLHPGETCWGPVWRPNSQQTRNLLKTTWWVPQLPLEKSVTQMCLSRTSEPQAMGGWGPHCQRPLSHYQQTDTPSGSRTRTTGPGSASSLWEHLLRASHTVRAAGKSHTGEYVRCCGLHWAKGSRRRPALVPRPHQPTLLLFEQSWYMNWRRARCKVLQRVQAGRGPLKEPCDL